jgi:hypothetical protein
MYMVFIGFLAVYAYESITKIQFKNICKSLDYTITNLITRAVP